MTEISVSLLTSLRRAAPVAIIGAALMLGGAPAGAASAGHNNNLRGATSAQDFRQARRDVGCIGYHGRPSGRAKSGKCLARRHS